MKKIFDRRKFNFNLMITVILLFLFGIILYNQRLIINTHDHVIEINQKIDQYFAPINDVELPSWEEDE
jgi:cell division protein FtsL